MALFNDTVLDMDSVNLIDLLNHSINVNSMNSPTYSDSVCSDKSQFSNYFPNWSDSEEEHTCQTPNLTPQCPNWSSEPKKVFLITEQKLLIPDGNNSSQPLQVVLSTEKVPVSLEGQQALSNDISSNIVNSSLSQEVDSTILQDVKTNKRERDSHQRHLSAEQRYRDSINGKLKELKKLLDGENSTLSKTQILSATIQYIKKLQKRHQKLLTENDVLRKQASLFTG